MRVHRGMGNDTSVRSGSGGKRDYSIPVLALLVAACTLLACGADVGSPLEGELLYGHSNRILAFDLTSRKIDTIFAFDRTTLPAVAAAIDSSTVLLEVRSPDGISIWLFNVRDHSLDSLTAGTDPVYVLADNSIYYYRSREGLFRTSLDSRDTAISVTRDIYAYPSPQSENAQYYPPHPVAIESGRLAYLNSAHKISLYDCQSGQTDVVDVEGCVPLGYSSREMSLLCEYDCDGSICLVDPTTGRIQRLDIKESDRVSGLGLVWADELDVLFFSRQRRFALTQGLRDLYVYSLVDSNERKYAEDISLRNGVYIRNLSRLK